MTHPPLAEAHRLVKRFCGARGIDAANIIRKGPGASQQEYVRVRHALMRRLREAGFSYETIGDVLQRHYSTVIYACRGRRAQPRPQDTPEMLRERLAALAEDVERIRERLAKLQEAITEVR